MHLFFLNSSFYLLGTLDTEHWIKKFTQIIVLVTHLLMKPLKQRVLSLANLQLIS